MSGFLWWVGAVVSGIGSVAVVLLLALLLACVAEQAINKWVANTKTFWYIFTWLRARHRKESFEQLTARVANAEAGERKERDEHFAFRGEMKRQFGETIDWGGVCQALDAVRAK